MSKRSKVSLTENGARNGTYKLSLKPHNVCFNYIQQGSHSTNPRFYYSFQANGLFTLPDTDSDADPCTDIRPKNGYSNNQDPDLD